MRTTSSSPAIRKSGWRRRSKPAVVEFLAERGLVLSPEKTKITHIEEGFDFLGWNIRKYDGKLLMKPSKANVKAHLDKIREVIKANKTAKQANLIRLLNPILRGWANYHSHVVAKETFARIDRQCLVNAMAMGDKKAPKRRAPNGSQRNTFKPEASGSWVFAATEKQEDGTKRELILLDECGHANTAACQDQIGRQSARPEVGTVLRDPMGPENAEIGERSNEALPRLVEARRHLPCLSGTNHPGQSLDCSASRETD